MESSRSEQTIDRRSFGSLGSLRSTVSRLTSWFSFNSKADDCISNSSRTSTMTWKWELYQARQRAQLEDYQEKLQEAQDNNDRAAIGYYQAKVKEYDSDLLDNISYRELDGGKLRSDTMKAQGRSGHRSIPTYD